MADVKTGIFNAARDGYIDKLTCLMESISPKETKELVNSVICDSTPLVIACRNGHTNIVEALVDKYHSDIELVGSVVFDGEVIDGAPPLWCAAASGSLSIVEYLISKGALVNNTTLTNSTPLRAACFDGHYEIVDCLLKRGADVEIANRHGHTCLMIACYKGHEKVVRRLIAFGSDINRSSMKGNTALHDCAESGYLNIMKLLLSNGAVMAKDCYGMTPLLAAAVSGHSKVVEYMIQRDQCEREEQITGLELLGATYVDKKRDILGALIYWKRAMVDRFTEPVIHKTINNKKNVAYDNAEEVQTIEALEDLIIDPDDMRMQALLVRERILGPAHPDTSYYIRYRGAVYADLGNFDRCISLWMYALDMQQLNLEPLSLMTKSSLLSFAELFFYMSSETVTHRPCPIQVCDVIQVFSKAVREVEAGYACLKLKKVIERKDEQNFRELLLVVMHLMSLVANQLKVCKEEELYLVKCLVYKVVKMNPLGFMSCTLLHMAVCEETSRVGKYPVCKFPSLEVARLLIELGADTNAVDLNGNTPLHVASKNSPCDHATIKLLLNHGAHLDARNYAGKTAEELMNDVKMCEIVCPLNYTTLQCLAAQNIMKHKLYHCPYLCPKLNEFLEKH